jgi:hypothetical protein
MSQKTCHAGHPQVAEFLAVWHENGRTFFAKAYPSLDYDSDAYRKTAKDRQKCVALDDGTSGHFLLNRFTGEVYTIKAYGVPNRRAGTIGDLIEEYRRVNEHNRAII